MIETVLMVERHNYFEMEMRPRIFLTPIVHVQCGARNCCRGQS